MTKRTRRNHSGAFKAKVAMAAIKGDRTLSELAQAFDVHANQITQWRTELLEGAASVFDGRAHGRKNPRATELGSGNIGGKTLLPGLYKWTSGVMIPSNVTLSGGQNAVWIFQIAGNLNLWSGRKIILSGGALPKNVFWQVAGKTTIGTTAYFNGNVLCKTAIVLKTGAELHGRALAQTAVTLDADVVKKPLN